MGCRVLPDVGVFDVTGQPSLLVSIDRTKAARYGLQPQDVNNIVQAAVGGAPVTTIIDGDRRFDFAVRYAPEFRDTPEAIGKILVPTPDGTQVPLSSVADVTLRNGAFMIYHEGGRRYIPIKFSVRGRDLASAIQDLQGQITNKVTLPSGYNYTWAGEFDSLRKEQQRLALIIPVSVADHSSAALHPVPDVEGCVHHCGHAAVCLDRRHSDTVPHRIPRSVFRRRSASRH